MKRKITSVSRLASQLTNPKPEFVSLVGHGANQEPFKALKSDIADFRGMDNQEDDEMTKAKKGDKLPNIAEVQKVQFTGKKFADESTVKEFLEAKGYTDFTVTKNDAGFEVIAKDAADFDGDVKAIDVAEGVQFFVGKLAEGKEGLEETVTEQKADKVFKAAGMNAAEIVKKYYDSCGYCCSTWTPPAGKTVADVLTEQYDNGAFPGMWDLNSAFQTALMNLVKEGDTAGIKTLTAEFGDMLVGILSALNTAGVDTTAVKAFFDKQPEEKTDMTTKKDKAPVKTDAEVKKTDGEQPAAGTETETPAADAPADEPKADAADAPADEQNSGEEVEKTDAPDMAKLIADAVNAAMSPLQKSITELSGTVSEIQKATKDSLAELDSKVSKTGERVEEIEQTRQTRKSADDNGVLDGTQKETADTQEEKAQKAHSERMLRNRIGIMG